MHVTSFKEYETGTTPEALLVKDLDAFDMIFQALEYEESEALPSSSGSALVH